MEKNRDENTKMGAYFATTAGVLTTLMAIGTVAYHFLEKWTWIDALYFTVITLATVGYGDLHPTGPASRLFTVFFVLFGVSVGVASITLIGGQYLSKREEKLMQRREEKEKKSPQSF